MPNKVDWDFTELPEVCHSELQEVRGPDDVDYRCTVGHDCTNCVFFADAAILCSDKEPTLPCEQGATIVIDGKGHKLATDLTWYYVEDE